MSKRPLPVISKILSFFKAIYLANKESLSVSWFYVDTLFQKYFIRKLRWKCSVTEDLLITRNEFLVIIIIIFFPNFCDRDYSEMVP